MLDYEYIKNHYRLIAVDLRRRKKIDVVTKAIQSKKFVGQLQKIDDNITATDKGNDESMFALTFLEKIKETRLIKS